jgi:hypothetical protein
MRRENDNAMKAIITIAAMAVIGYLLLATFGLLPAGMPGGIR